MSQENINRYTADIEKIQKSIEALKVDYAKKHDLAEQDNKAKVEQIQATQGKDVEKLEQEFNQKKSTLEAAEEAHEKAKNEFKDGKQLLKEAENSYKKALSMQTKAGETLLKNINSELNRETKMKEKEVKDLQKLISKEEKAINAMNQG